MFGGCSCQLSRLIRLWQHPGRDRSLEGHDRRDDGGAPRSVGTGGRGGEALF